MKPKAVAPSASAEWRGGSGNVAMRAGDGGGGSPALHKPKARKRGDTAVPAKRGLRPRRYSPCDRGQEPAPETRKARRLAATFCAGQKTLSAGRSEERRGGKECVRQCRSWWTTLHVTKKT